MTQNIYPAFVFVEGSLTHALPVSNRLQGTENDLRSIYTEALKHLKALVDLFINHEEIAQNSRRNITTQDLERFVSSAYDSVVKMDQVTSLHTEFFKSQLISLTRDIALKENKLNNYTTEQDFLKEEQIRWRESVVNIRQEQGILNITSSTKSANYHQPEKSRSQQLFDAENHLRSVSARLLAVQKSMYSTKRSLSMAQARLKQSRTNYIVLRDFGVQIKNVVNILTLFSEKLTLISNQELVVLLRPLGDLLGLLSKRQSLNG